MKQAIYSFPVIVRRDALEDVEQCRCDGPDDDVEKISPPSNP